MSVIMVVPLELLADDGQCLLAVWNATFAMVRDRQKKGALQDSALGLLLTRGVYGMTLQRQRPKTIAVS